MAITSEQTGCWSSVGLMNRGRQELNLQPGNPGCLNVGKGTAEHEMLHALGTFHEQSRPDRLEATFNLLNYFEHKIHFEFRDDYVRINEENIVSGKEHNFDKKNPPEVLLYGDYEIGSVMHYSRCAFTSNNMETITAIVGPICKPSSRTKVLNISIHIFQDGSEMGQRNGMTDLDVSKLMNYYECT